MNNPTTSPNGPTKRKAPSQSVPQSSKSTSGFSFDFSDDEDDEGNDGGHCKIVHSSEFLAEIDKKRDQRLKSTYNLLENFTTEPYRFAIVRESVFTLAGQVLADGDVVLVHWLASSHYDITVYPIYQYQYVPNSDEIITLLDGLDTVQSDVEYCFGPQVLNVFNLQDSSPISSNKTMFIPNLGTLSGPITIRPDSGNIEKVLPIVLVDEVNKRANTNNKNTPVPFTITNSSQGSRTLTLQLKNGYKCTFKPDLSEFNVDAASVNIRNLTFISPIDSIIEQKRVLAYNSCVKSTLEDGADGEAMKSHQDSAMVDGSGVGGNSQLLQNEAKNDKNNKNDNENQSNRNKIDENYTYTHRNTEYIFEIYPFLYLMPYPVTHPFPTSSNNKNINNNHKNINNNHTTKTHPIPLSLQTPTYPSHFSSAPLTIDSSLQSWTWPLSSNFFISNIFSKKCFLVHCSGTRLSTIRSDLSNFSVKSLIESSPSTIIWMKSLPNQHPNVALGEQFQQRTMQYIATSPETAFSAYLSGHTIYFNPIDPIQAKYVKGLAIQLGHGYGYTPNSNNFENDDEMSFLDENSSFGGDMEIFAVNSRHITDWHLDAQDNISIQLVGTKKWSVLQGLEQPVTNYHPKSTNKQSVCADRYLHQISQPHMNSSIHDVGLGNARLNTNQEKHSLNWANFDAHPDTEIFYARPGTIFYHPAGTYHKVEAVDDDGSLSLNISLDCLRYSDIVMSLVSQIVMSHPQLRQRVNINRDDIDGVMENAIKVVLPQLLKGLNHKDNDNCNDNVNNNDGGSDNGDGASNNDKSTNNNKKICTTTNDSTTIASSIYESNNNIQKQSGFVIPALFTNEQIHDFKLSSILMQPQHHYYQALSTLLYKDHGCVNLHQHLYLPHDLIEDVIFAKSDFKNEDGIKNNKFLSNNLNLVVIDQVLRQSSYVSKYYPVLSNIIIKFIEEYRNTVRVTIDNSNNNDKNKTTDVKNTTLINLDTINSQFIDKFDRTIKSINIINNQLCAVVCNEPGYIINTTTVSTPSSQSTTTKTTCTTTTTTTATSNKPLFTTTTLNTATSPPNAVTTATSPPNTVTTATLPSNTVTTNVIDNTNNKAFNELNHYWPNKTISMLSEIECDYNFIALKTLLTTIVLKSSNSSIIDLSTLPLIFSGNRFNALFHMYSVCSGVSTHNTTSNLTPSATNTKISPQYSIGIIIDSAKLIYGSNNQSLGQQNNNNNDNNNHAYQPNSKTNHIVLNILIFLHWTLQHSIELSIYDMIQCCELVALIGATTIDSTSTTTSPTTTAQQNNQNNMVNDNITLTFLQKLIIRSIIINFVALYTHCGVFLPR